MSDVKEGWFRVELDASGNTLSVQECDKPLLQTASVFYTKAVDGRKAQTLAKNAWDRERTRAKRRRLREKGLCRCGRKRFDKAYSLCDVCRENQRPSLVKSNSRLDVLLDVRDAWRDHPTVGGFTAWLLGEISSLLCEAPRNKDDRRREEARRNVEAAESHNA